jgi:GNAT superfamily N-acetyltransferase
VVRLKVALTVVAVVLECYDEIVAHGKNSIIKLKKPFYEQGSIVSENLSPHVFGKADMNDVPGIVHLNRQFHLNIGDFRWDTQPWIEGQIRDGNYYVLRDSNSLVGAFCLAVSPQTFSGDIEAIAVRADVHGKGIGKVLIEQAKDICHSRSLKTLAVESFCEYGLDGFYMNCGFTRLPAKEKFRGHE